LQQQRLALADPGTGGERLDPAALDARLEAEVEGAEGLAGREPREPQRGPDAAFFAGVQLEVEQLVEEAVRRQRVLRPARASRAAPGCDRGPPAASSSAAPASSRRASSRHLRQRRVEIDRPVLGDQRPDLLELAAHPSQRDRSLDPLRDARPPGAPRPRSGPCARSRAAPPSARTRRRARCRCGLRSAPSRRSRHAAARPDRRARAAARGVAAGASARSARTRPPTDPSPGRSFAPHSGPRPCRSRPVALRHRATAAPSDRSPSCAPGCGARPCPCPRARAVASHRRGSAGPGRRRRSEH